MRSSSSSLRAVWGRRSRHPAGTTFYLVVALLLVLVGLGAAPAQTSDVIERIRDEGMNRSQVMDTLQHLTEVIGPRLAGSPAERAANEWTRTRMAEWGLEHAHLESWGTFLPGWTLKRFSAQLLEPRSIPLIAYPKAWSPGLEALLDASAVHVDATDRTSLERFRGQLRGRIVLSGPTRNVPLHFEPDARRRTDRELLDLANDASPPSGRTGLQGANAPVSTLSSAEKAQFFLDEGVALVMEAAGNGDFGSFVVEAPNLPTSLQAKGALPNEHEMVAAIVPQVVVATEQYNAMVRMLAQGQALRLEIDFAVHFDPPADNYSTLAEIGGTDLADEIVMLGAHLDSLHSGSGATDNGTGVAVVMEAVRILNALGLQPRRTIRVALWGGEEVGLRGSRAYVERHFGRMDGRELIRKVGYDALSVYYNLDFGAGRIRGLYLHGHYAAYPLLRTWLAPFQEDGVGTLALSATGGISDHMSFDAVGLPGFFFIQDQLERSRTHHTNQDVLDRVPVEDLKHNAVFVAALVYQTAMHDEKLPRRIK